MSLPSECDWCGHPLFPWSDDEDTLCTNCKCTVMTWEHLTLAQTQRRIHLIKRREQWNRALDRAEPVSVKGEWL